MKRLCKTLLAFILVFTWFLGSNAMADHNKSFEGRKLFTTYCYLCHGLSGKGDGPLAPNLKVKPADLTVQKLEKNTYADLQCLVDGRCSDHRHPSKDMPKWTKYLPEPKIKALASYIHYLSSAKYPLIGNPEAGEHTYLRYCTPCHGEKGKGDGIMGNILSIKPADHTDTDKMDGRTNEQLINTITNGVGKDSLMPAWGSLLSEPEIRDLVSYIRLLSH